VNVANDDLMHSLAAAVDALGWTLIAVLWQAAAIAATYALLRLLIRSARARVTIGHLALLALVVAPALTFWRRLSAGAPEGVVAASTGVSDPGGALSVAPAAAGSGIDAWLPWIVGAWALGVLLLCARQWMQWRALRRLCRAAVPADAKWAG
jgi:hypothetical protein